MDIQFNFYFIFIFVVIILSFLLNLIADRLNIQTLSSALPDEFKTVWSPWRYRKSQLYTRTNTRFALITSLFDLIILIGFWLSGGFVWLDDWVRSFGVNAVFSGLLFFAVLMIANYIINLPFSLYHTFVIEQRFGFNKTTKKIFVLDQVKVLILSAVIGGLVLGGILWIFDLFGPIAWLYAAVASVLFIIFMQAFAPTLIMPLFNKFEPLSEGDLKESILAMTAKVKFPLKGVFVMDGSRRSGKSNAFFTGLGKNKRIALFDTLIENHTIPELTAVLAHEIGHYKRKHILKGLVITIVETFFMFFVFSLFLANQELSLAFGVDIPSVYTSLIFFTLLYSPLSLLLSILGNIYSRKNEFEADEFAATHMENHTAMADALKKLSADNLSNLTPHPFYVFIHYSHPPVLERIRAIKEQNRDADLADYSDEH